MNRPLATVGITAFDASDTIERAVHSALAQTWRPLEILVVDDASSDDTLRRLRTLARNHREMNVLSNENNQGVARSRNRLIAHARGEFIAFFDDDDESASERVEKQIYRLVKYEQSFANGAPVICHSARRLIYPDGGQHIAPTMGERVGKVAPSGWQVAERVLLGTPLTDGYGACATCSQLARVSTYRSFGGFDPAFRRSEDTEFNVRVAKAGGHFVGLHLPLVTQTMTRTGDKSLADEYYYLVKLLEKHREVADYHGMYMYCRNWIDVKQAWLEGRIVLFMIRLMRLLSRHPVLTCRRMRLAFRNLRLNRAFSQFMRRG